jgi:hypothetical protein
MGVSRVMRHMPTWSSVRKRMGLPDRTGVFWPRLVNATPRYRTQGGPCCALRAACRGPTSAPRSSRLSRSAPGAALGPGGGPTPSRSCAPLQEEYRAWREGMPDSMSDSKTARAPGRGVRARPRCSRRRPAPRLRPRLTCPAARRPVTRVFALGTVGAIDFAQNGRCEMQQQDHLTKSFGLIIAFIVPGMIGLYAASFQVPGLRVAAAGAGVFLSGLRWLVL